MTKQYGRPYLIAGLGRDSEVKPLLPLSYTKAKAIAGEEQSGGSYNEKWLQELIAAYPDILPFDEVGEPAFEGAVSISTELPIGGKFLDNFLVTPQGYLVLIECKLWRNPEARRTVVGQVLDYATEMSKWDYETLDNAVRQAPPAPGCVKGSGLYERVSGPECLPEPRFIDAVSRNLKRGRFLLLVVGDGVHEGVEAMAGFLQQHAGMHFTLGLTEMPVYRLPDHSYLVQPRVLARTVMIERGVVFFRDDRIVMEAPPEAAATSGGASMKAALSITEEMMLRQLDLVEMGLAARFQKFLVAGEQIALTRELTPTSIRLIAGASEDRQPLALIDPKNATVWFDAVASRAKSRGHHDAVLRYYQRLVELLPNAKLREEKLVTGTKHGVRSLPLSPLIHNTDAWITAAGEFLRTVDGEVA